MLSSDLSVKEVFFDSAECLSSEESIAAEEELGCSKLGYAIWVNEPPSVMERRESFLRRMGLAESISTTFSSMEREIDFCSSSEMMRFERLLECSGAVSSSCNYSSSHIEENSSFCSREGDNQANFMNDELYRDLQDKSNSFSIEEAIQVSTSSRDCSWRENCSQREISSEQETCSERVTEVATEEYDLSKEGQRKKTSWWKQFISKRKKRGGKVVSELSKSDVEVSKENRMVVRQNSKRYMEFAALCSGQEIQAHDGFIWTMKFSPDGQYLATGGEDGVVRIWRVTLVDSSCNYLMAGGNLDRKLRKVKSGYRVIYPDSSFRIEESPLQEFIGHSSDVLDLAWSNSNCLISSSMDKTVRLWEVGCSQCLNVFHHNDYVTCIQFNPLNDNYFISGSIDGKVRVWGLSEKRVVDWAEVRDVITALCYQPNGKGFVVGSIAGTCRFYEESEECVQLVAHIHIRSRRKTSGNKITGIQFSQENSKSQRVMVTSEDSKVRVFDGVDLITKYRGLPKSGSQMSASFTQSGKRIISVGEDSRVYLWDYDGSYLPSSNQRKSVRSCEHFLCEGVSVAIPWSGMGREQRTIETTNLQYCSKSQGRKEATPSSRDSDRFLLGNWFFDGPCRGSATWPEENLLQWDSPVTGDEPDHWQHKDHEKYHHHSKAHSQLAKSETWGLVIVTATQDGKIRTFHNYGLPVRL